MTFKILPRNSIAIADLQNKPMEDVAKKYDAGSKGYLTREEAYRLYADKHNDVTPGGMEDVLKFLGGAQHKVSIKHLEAYEVIGSPFFAHGWKGDFNAPGLGAGNIRTGREITPDYARQPGQASKDNFVFLIDCNLVDGNKLSKDIVSATLVVGPRGFKPEANSTVAEAVEIPLTLATQDGYKSYNRGGGASFVPEKKFLAAAVETSDLRDLTGGGKDLEFYVRLETTSGNNLYINKDGVAGQNFDVSEADLKPAGTA